MAWSPATSTIPKVGVCVPLKGGVSGEWAFAFAEMVKTTTVPMALYANGHFEIDYARNDLVDQARKDGCTHVFFLDGDILPFIYEVGKQANHHKFPEIIEFFLSIEYPIVSGVYWCKPGRSNLAAMSTDTEFAIQAMTGPLKDFVGREIYVDAVAIGCCLIDIRVFDHVPYPWFLYYRGKERREDGTWPELSEDFYFGRKAKLAGFLTLAMGSVVCGHEGKFVHTWGGDGVGR